MEVSKKYSKRLFIIIFIFVLIISAVINTGFYYCIKWLSLNLVLTTGKDLIVNDMPQIVKYLGWVSGKLYTGIMLAITGIILLTGVLLWIVLKTSLKGMLQQNQIENRVIDSKKKSKADFVDQKIEQDRKKRLFLHSLSILQREGRLLDFFAEDLSLYEDDQIGATVRSIQEDCKRAVKKYIDPKPVIEKEEGESIVIEPEFDIDSITLVGKVTGDLPFKCILKHRGWKAGKNEIPKLSDVRDASVIIPAEVEIQ